VRAVAVPKTAVRTENGQSLVFVVKGNVVERRAVKVGGTDGDRLEVIAGLQTGEQVVSPLPADLQDGAMVVVK
jgi:multidrug efflux pump subunit AcrA (membrane-fusion protein)